MHSHQNIRHNLAAALLLAALALTFTLLSPRAGAAFNQSSTHTDSLPSLNGAAAVEHLRQQGTYQSLVEAVAITRANAQSNSLIGEQTKLTANDGAANDNFGGAVAVSGNTAVIGAPFDDVVGAEQGSAYVFVRSGSSWTQQARLNALDGGTNDGFGRAVAINSNTVIIGAYGDEADRGSAYVFVRSGVTWSQQQKLTAADGVAADNFGSAVALSGETAVIGAPAEDLSTPQSKGAAYVFVRNGVTWSQQQKLVAADGLIDEEFGAVVALSGETAVIGNYNKQIGSNPNQGAAYVFVRNGTLWTQQQKLTAADGAAGDSFGYAVALNGDTLLVGALYDSIGMNPNQGSAYVFGRSGASWSQLQKLTASDAKAQDFFGNAVAINGSTLVIGAANIAANNNQGKAYVFARNGAAWQQQEILTATDSASGDRFGSVLALSGDTIVTGAVGDLIGANANQGSAYVFVIRDDTLVQQQRLAAADGVDNDQFGTAVALNGNTAVVSVTQDSHGNQSGLGAVYVFVRNGATWTQQAKLLAGDGAVGDYFGQALALSGDTLAVGAPEDDIGAKVDQGSVYVFVRNGAVWSQQTKLVNGLGAAGDRFGGAVALQGNTMVCGISYAQIGGMPKRGAAFVFVRNGVTWSSQALLTASDGAADDLFGSAVALSGDTAVIGSPGDNVGGLPKRGSAYAFVRNDEAWSQQAKLTAADGAADDGFGGAVALDGNTLVIGVDDHDNGANEGQGAAYVFIRNGAAWSQQQKLTVTNGALGDHFGRAVALSGDTLMIGAFWADVVNVNAGAVYSFTRSGATWTPQQHFASGLTETRFGWSVAFDGDTVLIGAPFEIFTTLRGAAYLYAANTCPAVGINPATLSNGTAGASYSQSLSASGGTAPYDFTVSFGMLPPGLTLSPSGLLSGTPAAGGSYSFAVTATAATLCPGSRAYTLTITGNCPAITVSPANAALPVGQAGQAYNQTFTGSGGAPGYNFVVSAGALPNGLTLSAAGVLSGAPIAFGNFSFTVKATDSNGCIGTRTYTLTISSPCAVTINPALLPSGMTGVAYSQNFAGSGGAAPYAYSLIVGAFPTGLSINAAGVLSGTPTQAGIFDFTVKVVDSNGCAGTRGYTVTINNGGGNPGLQFYPLSRPVRILDTRAGQG
ncbi:MAG: putative Ig domain-containing protein, partial [Acidobacteriota bacterium]